MRNGTVLSLNRDYCVLMTFASQHRSGPVGSLPTVLVPICVYPTEPMDSLAGFQQFVPSFLFLTFWSVSYLFNFMLWECKNVPQWIRPVAWVVQHLASAGVCFSQIVSVRNHSEEV